MSAEPSQSTTGAVSGSASDDALRETSAFQRAILECADYAIISTGPDGVIRTFNRAAERMLGYRAEEVVGKVTPEIIHDREEVARRAAELTAELGRPVPAGFETFVAKTRLGLAYEQEWTYLRKDGRRFPVQLSVTAMRDEGGQIIGFMGIAHDITRRRTAQAQARQLAEDLEQRVRERTAQLAASGQRFQLVVEASPGGIIMVSRAGRIVLVNAQIERLFGYAREELVGQPLDLLVPDRARHGHASQRAAFFAAPDARPMGAGRDLFGRRKDGSEFPVEIGLNPIQTEEGMAVLGTIVDISQRKEAERKLAAAARFPGENPSPVLRVGQDGLITYANPASQALLAQWRTGLGGPLPAPLGRVVAQALASGSRTTVDVTLGEQVFLLNVAPIREAGHVNLYGQDITERKRAEEALLQARDELEHRVRERTAELARANLLLHTEVEERKSIEAALRESEARLRTVIDSTPDWIFIKDTQFRFRLVNRSLAKAFHRSPEDFIGKDDLDIGVPADLVHGVPERGIRGFRADDREVLESGCTKTIAEEPNVLDGQPVVLTTVKVPLRDAGGKVIGVLGYVHDITELKAMEGELRHREEQLRDLFENATDLIQSIAPDGRILFVNRAWLNTLGYRMSDLAALTVFDIIHPDCLAGCREQFMRVMQGEPLTDIHAIFRAKDGRKIHVEGNASCRFEDGRPVATRAIFRDITKRKAVEDERERLIQELQAALAEVKTLSGLLPVCGWCKKIRDDSGYWDSVEGYLKKSSGMDITHGICPECQAKMMADLEQLAGTPPPAAPPAP